MTVRYWDSSVWISLLRPTEEPERHKVVSELFDEATAGNAQIVGSAIVLAEVIKISADYPLFGREQHEVIRGLFEHSFIQIRNVDRRTAELARELMWNHGLKHRDAVHVATALLAGVDEMFSCDDDQKKLNGLEIQGFGRMTIREPFTPQARLDFVAAPADVHPEPAEDSEADD